MRLASALAILLVYAHPAATQTAIAGTWQGYWTRAGDTLRVTLNVRRDTTPNHYSATFDSDRLRVSGIPFASVQVRNCCDVVLTLRGDRTTTIFTGRIHGDSLIGTLQEGDASGTFAYKRVTGRTSSFEERNVTFSNNGVSLAGSLLLPATGGAHAAVVFVHGSGAEGRWASRFLAAQLARNGIAALIYDKRGVGGSSGDWRSATLEDLAGDAAAAIAFLRRQPGIDSMRVGIHGHSQGGTLAPFVAARAGNVAFVIGSAAAGTPTDSTEIYSILNSVLPNATSAADSMSARTYVGELVDVAYHEKTHERLDAMVSSFRDRPWFFAPPAADNSYWTFSPAYGKYRPLDWWERVKVPVLLVYGEADERVAPEESAARIAATLLRAGNHDVTVRIFPNADHTFRLAPGPSGWPDTPKDYVPMLLQWLSER